MLCPPDDLLTATRFDLESHEYRAGRGERPAFDVLLAPVTVRLDLEKPRGRLHDWRLEARANRAAPLAPEFIVGATVRIAHGRTSPIALIDPGCRRIRTESGTVYELGTPAADFAAQAPGVLASLGFATPREP